MNKSLWGVISGKEKKPKNETEAATWEQKNEKALGLLGRALGPEYFHHVDVEITAAQSWRMIKALFGVKMKNSKAVLTQELFSFEMQEDENLVVPESDAISTSTTCCIRFKSRG